MTSGEDKIDSGNAELDEKIEEWLKWDQVRRNN
jgi:hypothetical protein